MHGSLSYFAMNKEEMMHNNLLYFAMNNEEIILNLDLITPLEAILMQNKEILENKGIHISAHVQ